MAARLTPPFRAEHVGSLIRPQGLVNARQAAATPGNGEARAELQRIQDAAIREVVTLQEELGFRVTTDGEFNRSSWQRDFLLKIKNVADAPSKVPVKFHSATGVREHAPPTLCVTGKLERPAGGMFVDDFKRLKRFATVTPKVTFPSPSVVHFRGGRDMIDRTAYPDLAEFYADLAGIYREEIADLAAAGCRYIQFDEVNLAYLCDPALRDHVRAIGEDPDALPSTYARLVNACLIGMPDDMTASMHLCRGNFAGHWVAEGGYEPIAEVLFNALNITGYLLEYDSERAGGFEPLRYLPKGKVAVLGLVTTKSPVLEHKDQLKRLIEAAERHVGLEQLALSPQCGFASGIGGETMTLDQQRAKLRLVVDTAREVWGSA